jgi:hypothetical protein
MEYIYFVTRKPYNGTVKIGKSINPSARLVSLNTGSYEKLIIYSLIKTQKSFNLEKKIHEHLKSIKRHHRLEWFGLDMDELDYDTNRVKIHVKGGGVKLQNGVYKVEGGIVYKAPTIG